MLVMCPRCKGRKNIMTLGYMLAECDLCEGLGKVEQEDKPVYHEQEKKEKLYVSNKKSETKHV